MNIAYRKITALLLALAMCLSLMTGCSKPETGSSTAPVADASASASSEEISDAEGSAVTPNESEGAEDASPSEPAPEESTPAAEESAPEEAPVESTVPADAPYDYTVKMDVTKVDFDSLSGLNNDPIPYGYNLSDRDDLNRPNGIFYYDNLYGENGGMSHVPTDEKLVYLTMDEGYENGCTPEILDTLKDKGVKAVFFITKQFYDENPDLIQRMIDEGHIVGNHTCAHPAGGMPQLGAKAEYEDIKWLNDAVYDTFGYQMRLFRYPEGVSSKQSIALLGQMGYTSVFWSFAYKDYDTDNQMDKGEALKQTLEQVHPGAVYLLHAVSTTNTAILGDWIDGVREKGFEFGVFPVNAE